jgi:hypothetical protein
MNRSTPTLQKTTALTITLALCACGMQPSGWGSGKGYGVAADDLDPNLVSNTALLHVDGDKITYVGLILNDSENKCGDFVKRLVAAESGTDTTLDILSTTFSALATAFTPMATVHALTAAGTVASGSKTAIDSNIFAKASIANFVQAIQSTYYADVNKYRTSLVAPGALIVPSIEVTKITPIHAECSLASAQATIAATLKGGQSSNTNGGVAAPPATPPPPLPGPPPAPAFQSPVPGHPV